MERWHLCDDEQFDLAAWFLSYINIELVTCGQLLLYLNIMAALMNTLFGEYLSVQQLFVILPYSPFPYLPTKVVKFLQSVCILSGIIEGEGKKSGQQMPARKYIEV